MNADEYAQHDSGSHSAVRVWLRRDGEAARVGGDGAESDAGRAEAAAHPHVSDRAGERMATGHDANRRARLFRQRTRYGTRSSALALRPAEWRRARRRNEWTEASR